MSNVRAGDPWLCVWCELDQHQRCLEIGCECLHEQDAWVHPDRRAELRAGAHPEDPHETALVAAYLAHRAEREAADARRR